MELYSILLIKYLTKKYLKVSVLSLSILDFYYHYFPFVRSKLFRQVVFFYFNFHLLEDELSFRADKLLNSQVYISLDQNLPNIITTRTWYWQLLASPSHQSTENNVTVFPLLLVHSLPSWYSDFLVYRTLLGPPLDKKK